MNNDYVRIRFIVALVCTTLAPATSILADSHFPEIEDAAIKRSKAMFWVNISESVTLRARGWDGDTFDCLGVEYDYIDLPNTDWDGSFLSQSRGEYVTFAPTSETPSTTITATICDKCKDGADPEDVDDPNVDVEISFGAYKVGCHMAVNANNFSDDETLWQNDGDGSALIQKTLGFIEARIDEDGDTFETSKYASCTWETKVAPGSASLGSGGDIKVPIKYEESGAISGKWADDDDDDGPTTVTVSLTGGTGMGAGVSISHSFAGDDNSAHVGFGLAFSSDNLGDCTTCKIEGNSDAGLQASWLDDSATYSNSVMWSTSTIGATSKAKAVQEAEMWVQIDGLWFPNAEAECKSDVLVKYKMTGKPSYDPGTIAADDGYY